MARCSQVLAKFGPTLVIWVASVTTCGAFGQGLPSRSTGEVTANDVYVRSGPSGNHYPLLKLDAGQRVTILNQQGAWYEVLPPAGSFSWISAEYVDSTGDGRGVVNGDNVRVRAGSVLPDHARTKYTVQTKLSRGSEVRVLGESSEGFLRIEPPPGATVWVAAEFVAVVDGSGVTPVAAAGQEQAASPTMSSTVTPSTAGTEASRLEKPLSESSDKRSFGVDAIFAGMERTAQREKLEEIESAIQAEMQKPHVQREFASILERLQTVAGQPEDELARRYAEARIAQINELVQVNDAVERLRDLSEEAEARRRSFMSERSQLTQLQPPAPAGLEIQGELRESALYPPGSVPRRYRLVDPSGARPRTIAYLEFPADAGTDPQKHLGQLIGIRASSRQLQPGAVDPVPVYVVSEVVPLETIEPDRG